MDNSNFFSVARDHVHTGLAEFAGKWGWYFALGVFLVVLGVIAIGMAVVTTMLSVVALGWILLAAGIGLAVLSFLTARWSGFLLTMAVGVLSIIAGIEILSYPLSGAVALTLIVGTILLVAGIFRSIASIAMQFPNWGWSLVSGIVDIVLGVLLLNNIQNTALWFIGFAIGVDLILHGISWMTFSLAVQRGARDLGITEIGRRVV